MTISNPATSSPGIEAGSEPADSVELTELLRQAERRAAIRRVASALAHAVGTPLNVIAGRAALIAQAPLDKRSEHAASNAQLIERQVEALTERIQQMLKRLRADPVERQPCIPASLLDAAAAVYAPLAERRKVAICVTPSAIAALTLPRQAILLVLVDLISLGLSLVHAGGRLDLEVRHEYAEPPAGERGRASAGNVARFRVHYAETRLAEDVFANPHEPWNASEQVDLDHAQLVSVCFGVLREHGGWIDVVPIDGGTSIIGNWPCH